MRKLSIFIILYIPFSCITNNKHNMQQKNDNPKIEQKTQSNNEIELNDIKKKITKIDISSNQSISNNLSSIEPNLSETQSTPVPSILANNSTGYSLNPYNAMTYSPTVDNIEENDEKNDGTVFIGNEYNLFNKSSNSNSNSYFSKHPIKSIIQKNISKNVENTKITNNSSQETSSKSDYYSTDDSSSIDNNEKENSSKDYTMYCLGDGKNSFSCIIL